jgi:hypothetical protein
MAASGVTRGCNPPGNDRFCPDDLVTRGQMAAFMRRFARFLGAENGVVDKANTAINAWHAGTSSDSGLLDGYNARDLIQVSWCGTVGAPNGADYECAIPMDVPVDGGVVINASAETWAISGSDDFACELRLDGVHIEGSWRDVTVDRADGSYEANCATSAGTWITAGTHWITFNITFVDSETGIGAVGANAVFSPFVPMGNILSDD